MHWSWWQSGLALSGIALGNWFLTRRMLAVSGRFTALVNRLRDGAPNATEGELSEAELLVAMRELTAQEFGADAVEAPAPEPTAAQRPLVQGSTSPTEHVMFFAALVAGGFLSAILAGPVTPTLALRSALFPSIFGTAGWSSGLVLLLGGALVGFGTRMAAGCTSGHGLCGVSRLQKGSLLATCAFFGAGIVASIGLQVLL